MRDTYEYMHNQDGRLFSDEHREKSDPRPSLLDRTDTVTDTTSESHSRGRFANPGGAGVGPDSQRSFWIMKSVENLGNPRTASNAPSVVISDEADDDELPPSDGQMAENWFVLGKGTLTIDL